MADRFRPASPINVLDFNLTATGSSPRGRAAGPRNTSRLPRATDRRIICFCFMLSSRPARIAWSGQRCVRPSRSAYSWLPRLFMISPAGSRERRAAAAGPPHPAPTLARAARPPSLLRSTWWRHSTCPLSRQGPTRRIAQERPRKNTAPAGPGQSGPSSATDG